MDRWEGGSIILFRRGIFVSHCRKFRRRTIMCFRNFPLSKNVRDKRGGGYHDFPSNFLSPSTKIFSRETLLCCRLFRVLKNFTPKRGMLAIFIEKMLSHSTENFCAEPFSVSLSSVLGKFFA